MKNNIDITEEVKKLRSVLKENGFEFVISVMDKHELFISRKGGINILLSTVFSMLKEIKTYVNSFPEEEDEICSKLLHMFMSFHLSFIKENIGENETCH